MDVGPHAQSLGDFRQNEAETPDRLNRTGEAEWLTVDGEVRAVILSPVAYDELARDAQATRDVAVIRRSMRDIDEGRGREAGPLFDRLRARLLAMKAGRPDAYGRRPTSSDPAGAE